MPKKTGSLRRLKGRWLSKPLLNIEMKGHSDRKWYIQFTDFELIRASSKNIFILFTTPGTIVHHISFTLEFPGDFFNIIKTVSLYLPNSSSRSKHRFLFSVFHFPIWFSVSENNYSAIFPAEFEQNVVEE